MNSYSTAERINSQVNASVTYKTDLEQYSRPEFWVEANTFGDCEDYALLKRLKRAGLQLTGLLNVHSVFPQTCFDWKHKVLDRSVF